MWAKFFGGDGLPRAKVDAVVRSSTATPPRKPSSAGSRARNRPSTPEPPSRQASGLIEEVSPSLGSAGRSRLRDGRGTCGAAVLWYCYSPNCPGGRLLRLLHDPDRRGRLPAVRLPGKQRRAGRGLRGPAASRHRKRVAPDRVWLRGSVGRPGAGANVRIDRKDRSCPSIPDVW